MFGQVADKSSQSKKTEQVESSQTGSPYDAQSMKDVLRLQLAFSGASSRDTSGPTDSGVAPFERNDKDNRQIDQQASTSGSDSGHGGSGHVKDKQKLAEEYFMGLLKHDSQDVKDAILQRFDTSDIVRTHRSYDEGYKILNLLDDKRRREVLENLKISDIAEHFSALKTSDETNKFLKWINPGKFVDLYQYFAKDTNNLKKFLRVLDIEQLAKIANHLKYDYEKKALYEKMPLESLGVLIEKFGVKYPNFQARQHAEYFNILESHNERKAFVRELELKQVADLYNYFYGLNNLNKQKELCRAMAREDLQKLVKECRCGRLELETIEKVEWFSSLEIPSQRRRFFENSAINICQITAMYRYFDYDTSKQKQLCRSMPLKQLRSLIEELSLEESEVARSCLKEE